MIRFSSFALVASALVLGGHSVAAEAEKAKTIQIGDQISDFTFKDIRYLPRRLSEFGEKKAYVIVFTNLDCPLVKRYLPRLKDLDLAYRDRGVQFIAMNAAPGDPIIEVAYQAIKAECEFPFCKDFSGEVVRALGADRTPEAFVLDSNRVLRYRGRIDSQYRLGGVRPDTGRDDLKEAIEDVLADREVRVAETPVDGCKITLPGPIKPTHEITYADHVAAIIKKHCQECHRPNTTAPFALLTYDDVKANGETIAEVVDEQRMPPCFASNEQTDIVNRRMLTREERETVIAWVKSGMAPGDLAKAPAPIEPPKTKWQIGEPDLVIKYPKPIKIPAQGDVAYKYLIFPHQFDEDTWVQKIEIMPGNRDVVHHANLAALVGSKIADAAFITGYVPGGDAMMLDPHHGFKIPKGARLVLQTHYITIGEETTDQTTLGFVFAKDRIEKEIKHFRVTTGTFAIPPGAPHHRVEAERQLAGDATGIGMFTHMHLRGKDMIFEAIYPNGQTETLLAIPNYNFDWQMNYRWEPGTKKFPKGTKIHCTAHYDNSRFNPYNPDPTKEVREGDQTYEEMMFGFFFYTLDDENLALDVDPATGHVVKTATPDQQATK
jgi:mono/diheme cytochrome c family protein